MSTYPGINPDKITEREFHSKLEQAINNIIPWKLGNKLEFETQEDQAKRLRVVYNQKQKSGKW